MFRDLDLVRKEIVTRILQLKKALSGKQREEAHQPGPDREQSYRTRKSVPPPTRTTLIGYT